MPLSISLTLQNIAVAVVFVLAAIVLWRRLRRPRETGCSACSMNPDTSQRNTSRSAADARS